MEARSDPGLQIRLWTLGKISALVGKRRLMRARRWPTVGLGSPEGNAYKAVSDETRERLWPEPETRPEIAWIHSHCQLIVTNRADHDPRIGRYPCPSPR